MTDFDRRFAADRELAEQALKRVFQDRNTLCDAMRYSLLAGGKRLRPVLTLECSRLCGGADAAALNLACAVEMVHTYSLIHDDLPCMDNDDLRRGKLTNHKVFGEAMAVLAGDGLLTAAFETAAGARLPAQQTALAVAALARAAGPAGMVGGQALEMTKEGQVLTEEELGEIHRLKTGALLSVAADLGCIAAGALEEDRRAVRAYAGCMGLAFQIRDDMLDVEGSLEAFGKPIGSDAANGKHTFVSLKGLEGCRTEVDRLTREAVEALSRFPESGFLAELARRMAKRNW